MTKREQLEKISEKVKKCQLCGLSQTRNQAVPGEGQIKKRIVMIGEAPGRSEDLKGVPFVGRAGNLLDELIELAGLTRKEVFITNIVKCRPPQNRDPLPEEAKSCFPYLQTQLKTIQPRIIILLGRHAMYRFLPETLKISRDHGKLFKVKEKKSKRVQIYYPVYHPAAALYHQQLKQVLEQDFKNLSKVCLAQSIDKNQKI